MRSNERPSCPDCDSPLKAVGSRKRIIRRSDGERHTLIIRRLKCGKCGCLHHELPDIIVPYKRYDAETIEKVLSEKENTPSFPCETSTAVRLRVWFLLLRSYFEGTVRSLLFIYRRDRDLCGELSGLASLDPAILENGWLKRLVRTIVNSGRWRQTRSAYAVR